MDRAQKKDLIQTHQKHAKDTGSAEVQIAILTKRINTLTEHFKVHTKDIHGKKGLIGLVSKRRKLLDYLKSKKPESYTDLIKKLGIRK